MIEYDVSKEKGGQYYVHPYGRPERPINGSYGDKKKAMKFAARLCGMTPSQYKDARKHNEENMD